jgi:hypothetical protein
MQVFERSLMELHTTAKARIAFLNGEIDSVHSDNRSYWEDKAPSHEANAEYQRRQHWLERIKNELAELGLEGKMQANPLPTRYVVAINDIASR